MLNKLTLLFAFLLTISFVKGEIISLAGVYEGINLYVENDTTKGGSCIKEIFVNDLRIDIERDKPFFEIDMSFLKLKENVTVKMICEPGCKAKILNPEAINIMYGFQFMSITIEPDKIEWITNNEKQGGKYVIELQVDKQWVPVGEVVAKPSRLANFYEKKLETMKNHYYRVKYIDKDGIPHSSKPVKHHKNIK